ncbi:MAG: hypothetical protein M3Q19_05395 [Pseudomonadota bacterium]|nr:hypothetical protein [Pseudomonadota bacterium]
MIATFLLLQQVPLAPSAPAPPPGPQPQIAWACDMTGPDKKKFQLAGKITGGVLPPGEKDPAKLTKRLATVTTDTSRRLKGTVGFPYIFASWKGEGFFTFSMPAQGDRYQVALQLFEGGRPGYGHMTLGYPHAKEVLGIGYCISRFENVGQQEPPR